jgi:hypothetical protein
LIYPFFVSFNTGIAIFFAARTNSRHRIKINAKQMPKARIINKSTSCQFYRTRSSQLSVARKRREIRRGLDVIVSKWIFLSPHDESPARGKSEPSPAQMLRSGRKKGQNRNSAGPDEKTPTAAG